MKPVWRKVWPAVAAVAVVQTAVLGWMVADRVRLLANGLEVVLPIVPVDPRSLFRGDYVRLSYDVTRVPGALIEGPMRRHEPLFVTIERQPDGTMRPVAAGRVHPGAAAADKVVLHGRIERERRTGAAASDLIVSYGIESYFVPEGTGLELENMARESKLAAVIAVGGDGRSAIKGLMIDGKLAYEEPLF